MGRKADDFANSGIGGFICWAAGIYGSYRVAGLARHGITASGGFFRNVLGVLVGVAVFAICLFTFLCIWLPFTQRSDFRKATDPAINAIKSELEAQRRELTVAQSNAKKRIVLVREQLQKIN